jgi:hypothetical protein
MHSTPESRADLIRRLERLGDAIPPPPPEPPLNNGDDGGKSPDMEPRVAKLEAHMEHVRADIAKLLGLPETTGRIEERVKSLPDKDWVGTKMRNWVGGVGTVLGILMIALKYIG